MPPRGRRAARRTQIDVAGHVPRDGVRARRRRCVKPDPGRVTARRLNRAEYTNTIRDLLAVDFRADKNFPTDDSGEGFDNIGDILTVSPVLMEKYLSRRRPDRRARRSPRSRCPKPIEVEYSLRFKNLRRLDPSNVEATHRVDFDAEYDLRIGLPGERADGRQAGDARPLGGRQAPQHDAGRDQALRPGLLQSLLGRADARLPARRRSRPPSRASSTTTFVKTLAKERRLQGQEQQVDRLGHDRRAVPVEGREGEPQEDPRLRSEDGRGLRRSDPRRRWRAAPIAGPVTPAEVASLDEVRAHGEGRRPVDRAGHRAGDPGDARLAALPLPHRARSEPDRSDRDAPDLRRRAGVAAELLPVELDARREAAVARRTPAAARAGDARRAGEADAGRSEGVRDGRELRRPVAGNPQPRQHQAGPAEVPGLGAGAARRDEDRDADVLRLHAAREPADRRVPRRALHVPQRVPGEVLRHRGREGAGLPARRAHDRRARRRPRARAACWPCRAIRRGRRW